MKKHTLLLDIGNSKIKASTLRKGTLSNLPPFENEELLFKYITEEEPQSIHIASVVPAITKKIIKEFGKKIKIHQIDINSQFGFTIKYQTPETLGIDRLCGIEGALYYANENHIDISGVHLITIDFGTATTINILNEKREFTGGVIAPGLITMIKSLSRGTAQLPEIGEGNLITFPGFNTATSIGSGVMNAQIGLVERVIGSIPGFDNKRGQIFVTGGNYKFLKDSLTIPHTYIPNLVIIGLASITLKEN
ncbi:MAG: type III pantothenate kinase [Ignavibacteriaceae bacterium]